MLGRIRWRWCSLHLGWLHLRRRRWWIWGLYALYLLGAWVGWRYFEFRSGGGRGSGLLRRGSLISLKRHADHYHDDFGWRRPGRQCAQPWHGRLWGTRWYGD